MDPDVWKKAYAIQNQNTVPHVLSRGGYEYLEQNLMVEKTKKKLEEDAQSKSTEGEQASQGSFVPHGRQDLLTAAIGRPEHPSHVRVAEVGVTIKQYFGPAERTSRTSSSIAPEELEQLTQQIRDQLEESITEKVTRQLMLSISQMQSQLQSQIQSQGLALPLEPEVGPSAAHVSTKGSCVDPSAINPNTGRVYEGSITVHNILLLHDQVKVGVEQVKDADAPVPVPTDEVMWDASLFGLFNSDFPLYIKHEDLSKIAHGGQCLSISVIQLWILHLTETSMRLGNSDVYEFLEPQSIQRSGQSHAQWQMVVILPKENLVVWFCSLHHRPDNYLKGIINIALKEVDGTPQPKSKVVVGARWIVVKYNKQKESTECDYYVMHWLPLESDTLKALRIQWANYYLKVRNET
ncbi:hypothetical protein HKD37_06G016419 [Glycine soja]